MRGDKRRYRKGTIVVLAPSIVRDIFFGGNAGQNGWVRALGSGEVGQTALTLVEHTWCDNGNGRLSRMPVMLSTGEVINLLAGDLRFPHQIVA